MEHENKLSILLTMFLIVVFSGTLIAALTEKVMVVKITPMIITIPGIILCSIQLYREIKLRKVKAAKEKVPTGEYEVEIERNYLVKVGTFFAWVAGFFFVSWLLGFAIGVITFIIAYVWVRARARWYAVILSAVIGFALLYYFGEIMLILWPKGIFQDLVDPFLNPIWEFLRF